MSSDIPHRKGHQFENPWPGVKKHGVGDFLKWTIERRRRRSAPVGEANLPKSVQPSFVAPRASPDSLAATWIGHTTVLLQLCGLNILTDPVWSDRASPFSFVGPRRFSAPGVAFDSLPIIDAVVISHDRYDHLDSETVEKLTARFPAAAWRVPLGVGSFIRSR